MQIEQPPCEKRNCIYYMGLKWEREEYDNGSFLDVPIPYCLAFPEGIPEEILLGDNKHLEPVKGDSGITYEEE